jgi:hypothetical protein
MKALFYLLVSLLVLSCTTDDTTEQLGEQKQFEAVGTWTYQENGNTVSLNETSDVAAFKKWLEINSNLTDISISSYAIEVDDVDANGVPIDFRITCMLYAKANPDNDPAETPNDYKLSFENLNGQVFFIGNIKDLTSLNLQGLSMISWDSSGDGGLAKHVIDNYPGLKYWDSSNNQEGDSPDAWTDFYKSQILNLCSSNGGTATF